MGSASGQGENTMRLILMAASAAVSIIAIAYAVSIVRADEFVVLEQGITPQFNRAFTGLTIDVPAFDPLDYSYIDMRTGQYVRLTPAARVDRAWQLFPQPLYPQPWQKK
jgi:hypothetical protein